MPQFFDVRGEWDAQQSNGFRVHFFNMTQRLRAANPAFTDIEGRATHSGVEGRVEGSVSGDHFFALVFWENETEGEYSGRFGLDGAMPSSVIGPRITGFTHDVMNPESQATWFSFENFLQADF